MNLAERNKLILALEKEFTLVTFKAMLAEQLARPLETIVNPTSNQTYRDILNIVVKKAIENDWILPLISGANAANPKSSYLKAFVSYAIKTSVGEPRFRLFMSCCDDDLPEAERIADYLETRGYEVWYKKNSMPEDGTYHDAIERKTHTHRLGLILVSPNSIKPGWARNEMHALLRRSLDATRPKLVLLVILISEKCEIPLALTTLMQINMISSFDKGLNQLLLILGSLFGK